MNGKQVLQAIKEIKISNKASLFLILFRWVYFLSKANVKNCTKIRDSMLTWLKRVTAFQSHAKGHAILCDVYYLLTNGWSDERFSKSKSLVCVNSSLSPEWSKLLKFLLLKDRSDVLWLYFDPRPDCSDAVANKRTFIVWLKSIDFVSQNDATEVGNNLPRCKNVLQAMVSNPFM